MRCHATRVIKEFGIKLSDISDTIDPLLNPEAYMPDPSHRANEPFGPFRQVVFPSTFHRKMRRVYRKTMLEYVKQAAQNQYPNGEALVEDIISYGKEIRRLLGFIDLDEAQEYILDY